VYKGQGEDDEDAADDQGTRFVVEFSLSRLGDMQLDGLIKHKRFDLILRSTQDLSAAVRDHITTLFTQANEITGFVGGVQFQAVPGGHFPVDPRNEIAGPDRGMVV